MSFAFKSAPLPPDSLLRGQARSQSSVRRSVQNANQRGSQQSRGGVALGISEDGEEPRTGSQEESCWLSQPGPRRVPSRSSTQWPLLGGQGVGRTQLCSRGSLATGWRVCVGNADLGTCFHISTDVPFQVPSEIWKSPWRSADPLPLACTVALSLAPSRCSANIR